MTSFLNELAKQLAGKWLALLLLPGALYVATGLLSWRIGQGSWFVSHGVVAALRAGRPGGVLVAALLAALLLSAAAGLVAGALGRFLHWIWLGQWSGRTGVAIARRRRNRWDLAHETYAAAYRGAAAREELARLAQRRNRIALAPPVRPTHMGDALAAMSTRVEVEYGLDLEYGWPRLWLALPEDTRTVLTACRDAFNSAATLGAWGLLYLALAALWWPVAVAGVIIVLVAHQQGRAAAVNLAQLMESAVDLHGGSLATSLGVDMPEGRLAAVGREITRMVRKGA